MKKKFNKEAVYNNFEKLKNNKQAVVFLVCVLIATALWFLNALGKDYSTTISYPVKYVNAPSKQFLANEPPTKLELKVDAHGFTLLRHKLSLSFSPIILNLTNITKNVDANNGMFTIPTSGLMHRIRNQVSSEISIVEVHPLTIPILLDSLKTKTVQVKADIELGFKPEFNLKYPVSINPSEIKITGPSAIIDTIDYLFTEEETFEELSNSTEKYLEVVHPKKTKITPEKVLVKIDVEKFTEKELRIPIGIENKPADVNIKLFPSEVRVTCLVGLSRFEEITPNDFSASVDYKSISESNNLAVNVEQKTTSIQLVRQKPEHVEFLIETN